MPSAPALPGLPLLRLTSDLPAAPQGPAGGLPRNVEPPSDSRARQAGAMAQVLSRAQLPCYGSTAAAARYDGGLLLPPLRSLSPGRLGALPPRDVSSRGGSVLPLTSGPRRGGSDFSLPFGDSKDPRVTFAEVESLRRQVMRLTQLRAERDTYIRDLLADADAMQRRHEGELARRTTRSQREVTERLSAQEREHQQRLQERNKAHDASLAQQDWQHCLNLEEQRKTLEANCEQELAKRLSEAATAHRQVLERLRRTAQAFVDKLAAHVALLEGTKVPAKPELESDAVEELGERVSGEDTDTADAAAAAERVLEVAHSTLERLLAVEAPSAKAAQLVGYASRYDAQREALAWRVLRCRAELWCHAAFRAWAATIAHTRLRSEAAGCTVRLRQQLQGRCLDVANSELARKRHVALRAWAEVVVDERRTRLHREEAEMWKTSLQDSRRNAAEFERRLRDRSDQVVAARQRHELAKVVFGWLAVVRERRKEAAHRHELHTAAADYTSELYRQRTEAHRLVADLRRQRRAHGVAAIHASLDRHMQAVVQAWSTVAGESKREAFYLRQLDVAAQESAAGCAVLRMEWRRCATQLREQRRAQGLKSIAEGLRHCEHVVLYAWAAVAADAQQKAAKVTSSQQARGKAIIAAQSSHLLWAVVAVWFGLVRALKLPSSSGVPDAPT